MQYTTSFLAACLLATSSVVSASLVGASPIVMRDARNAAMTKRATIFDEVCGGVEYDSSWVQGAFDSLSRYANIGGDLKPSAGTTTYPKVYGATDLIVAAALNRIDGCATEQAGKTFLEYPLSTGEVFNGGPQRSQGPARVIAIGNSPVGQGGQWTDITYCLAVFHPTQNGGSFYPCTETG